SGIDRTRLLYRDDRQVQALIVRYHLQERGSKPGVWVTAEPFRDFLADLNLVDCVSRDDFEDDGDWWRRSIAGDLGDDPFQGNEYCDRDGFRRLAEFEHDRERVLQHLSNDAYESLRQMRRM